MIYHILTVNDWRTAYERGHYSPPSLTTEGFIHFSQAHQVLAVANTFYHNAVDLVLLAVDPARLSAPLRYEPPAPLGFPPADVPTKGLFPHLYGPLNLEAIVMVWPLLRGQDGFRLPFEQRP